MSYSNGHLPRSALAPITRAANGEQAYLEKRAAASFMAMNAESEQKYGVTLRVTSARVAYRDIDDQWYFWNLMKSGRGALAAYPGTSNHGWGLAIDLYTLEMRQIVNAIGHKYGWAKEWSDAPTEWWHIKYRPGVWNGKMPDPTPHLRLGSHGQAVARVQRLLRQQGYKVNVDGDYGRSTANAISNLYVSYGYRGYSHVGDVMWSILLGRHPWRFLTNEERAHLALLQQIRRRATKVGGFAKLNEGDREAARRARKWLQRRLVALGELAERGGWVPNHRGLRRSIIHRVVY